MRRKRRATLVVAVAPATAIGAFKFKIKTKKPTPLHVASQYSSCFLGIDLATPAPGELGARLKDLKLEVKPLTSSKKNISVSILVLATVPWHVLLFIFIFFAVLKISN